MSLKNFHIAFITVCTLFFGGLGALCLMLDDLPGMLRVLGWVSVACGLVMFVYGLRFLKKIRTLKL